MTRLLSGLCVLALLAGCASSGPMSAPSGASPAVSRQAECERTGGVWRPSAGVCDETQGAGY